MAIADLSTTADRVQRQYEMYPYPQRDPADEDNRLARTKPDELDVLNHYCFQGRRDFRRGFRALIAGGGTGDATIFLAHQLANTDATVVYLDLSNAAMEIARQRARRRSLEEKISWIHGSLLDLPGFGLEPFDYINCGGVLHHLEDPAAGLAALVSVLKDDGALGLMLYGRYGRTGVYQMQQLMRLINHDEDRPQVMLDNTRETYASLPITNWLKRSPGLIPKDEQLDDTELYDMFLHASDQPFSVLDLYQLLDGANLHLVEFLHDQRALYDPQFAFRSGGIQSQVAKLPRRYQQAAAELFWGTLDRHSFWAARRSDTVADPRNPDNVPAFSQVAECMGMPNSILTAANSSSQAWRPSIQTPQRMTISFKLEMNHVNRQLIRLIDGRRTMGEIVRAIVSHDHPSRSADEVWSLCCGALEALQKFDFVVLRHVSVPAIRDL